MFLQNRYAPSAHTDRAPMFCLGKEIRVQMRGKEGTKKISFAFGSILTTKQDMLQLDQNIEIIPEIICPFLAAQYVGYFLPSPLGSCSFFVASFFGFIFRTSLSFILYSCRIRLILLLVDTNTCPNQASTQCLSISFRSSWIQKMYIHD